MSADGIQKKRKAKQTPEQESKKLKIAPGTPKSSNKVSPKVSTPTSASANGSVNTPKSTKTPPASTPKSATKTTLRRASFGASPDKKQKDKKGARPSTAVVTKSNKKAIVDVPETPLDLVPSKNQQPFQPKVWSITPTAAGRFLDIDPIFSDDEKYLLVPSQKAVHVYSTANSLEEWFLEADMGDSISAVAKTSKMDNIVFTATSSGKVTLWNWLKREELDHWEVGTHVSYLATSTSPDNSKIYVYAISSPSSSLMDECRGNKVVYREVDIKTQKFVGNAPTILSTTPDIRQLYSLPGNILVVVASKELFVGRPAPTNPSSFQWHCIPVDRMTTSVDLKFSDSKRGLQGDIDIALGTTNGEVFVYKTVFSNIAPGKNTINLVPRKLHWHRNAVGSVKWSRDGNYLISGGQETVLVLWQLSTGTNSLLPHLTAEIGNITVSPFGASYAVRLSDNSIMVLSTAELEPTSYFSGIQARTFPQWFWRNNPSVISKKAKPLSYRTPLVADPLNSNLIHIAAPISQLPTTASLIQPAAFLQTFDFLSNRHIRRQAITRNHTTYAKVGPNKVPIFEPNVTLMEMSFEACWLATVEEWTPPELDAKFLGSVARPASLESERRTEVFLKIWKWDTTLQSWALNSRMENPHGTSGNLVHSIRDMAAHPSQLAFTTVGDDCIVRVWTPKVKTQNGVPLRGTDNHVVVSWSCASVTELRRGVPFLDLKNKTSPKKAIKPLNARVAYSNDGSVIAASADLPREQGSMKTVHFIDSFTGEVSKSEPGLYVNGLVGLDFVGRHLVILAQTLTVWDVVSNQRVYTLGIKYPTLAQSLRINLSHIVANSSSSQFAIAIPIRDQETGSMSTEVSVFSPAYPDKLVSTIIGGVVTALKSIQKSENFIVLDSNAEISLIHSPRGRNMFVGMKKVTALAGKKAANAQKSIVAVTASKSADVEEGDGMDIDLDEDDDSDRPVVRASHLSQIFETGPSHALPPLESLFNSVAGLVMAKPRPSVIV